MLFNVNVDVLEIVRMLDLINASTCSPTHNYLSLVSDIDECSSWPCQNGGSCLDVVDFFRCTCVAGYTGVQCESGKRLLIFAVVNEVMPTFYGWHKI